MIARLQEHPLWGLISQADLISKFLLVILLCMSIISLAIVVYKWLYYRYQLASLKHGIATMKKSHTMEQVIIASTALYGPSSSGRFFKSVIHDLQELLTRKKSESAGQVRLLSHDIDYLEAHAHQTLDTVLLSDEKYVSILGVSAAVSPLIGLFGTIWGLIHAFVSISHEKTADITVVAPGIAEALITTLAGLVVAIPALIFFHVFMGKVRKIEHMLSVLLEMFIARVKRAHLG